MMQAWQTKGKVYSLLSATCPGQETSRVPLGGSQVRQGGWFPKKQRLLKVTENRAEEARTGDVGHTRIKGAHFQP